MFPNFMIKSTQYYGNPLVANGQRDRDRQFTEPIDAHCCHMGTAIKHLYQKPG